MTVSPPPERITESQDTFPSGGHAIRVELWEPAGRGPWPAVLLLHGAGGLGYRGGTYREMARGLARSGYRALLVHYLDATGGRLTTSPADPVAFASWLAVVGDAVGYAAGRPGADPGKVGLVGVSLGAYLALSLATQDRRIGAVVECCGGLPDFFAVGLTTLPPVLILHGDADPVVPVAEARKLERLLRDRGLAHEVKIYPGLGHGFAGAASRDAFGRAVDFLNRHLKASAGNGRRETDRA